MRLRGTTIVRQWSEESRQEWVHWQQAHHPDLKVDNTRNIAGVQSGVWIPLNDAWRLSLIVPADAMGDNGEAPSFFEATLMSARDTTNYADPPAGIEPNQEYRFNTNEARK